MRDQEKTGVKVYFRGGEGLKNPIDANGNVIKVGDKLSWDFHDDFYQKSGVKDWMRTTRYVVELKSNGTLFGRGIDADTYLHDFQFKYCEIVE